MEIKKYLLKYNQTYKRDFKVKNSIFIVIVFNCPDFIYLDKKLKQIKKEYFNANHHCFAAVIDEASFRYSDAGEPSGTAGKPIYDALRKHQLIQTAVIVVRFFGGTKLGTGGLTKAYFESTDSLLCEIERIKFVARTQIYITCSYALLKTVEYCLKQCDYLKTSENFENQVHLYLAVKTTDLNQLHHLLIDNTQGSVQFSVIT